VIRGGVLLLAATIAAGAAIVLTRGGGATAVPPLHCRGGSMYFSAHEDDPILFQLPDIQRDIFSGRCVRVVILTAGDAGQGEAYWRNREAGTRAALAVLAHKPDAWVEKTLRIPGHPIPLFTLSHNVRVSVAFMRLPDGRSDGEGFGHGSMQQLLQGRIRTLVSLREPQDPDPGYRSTVYTKAGLEQALLWLLNEAQPRKIGTQDYAGGFGPGDHSDHRAGARFVVAAAAGYKHRATLVGYLDYVISRLPPTPDITAQEAEDAAKAWFAYVPHDSAGALCRTQDACVNEHWAPYWNAEYTIKPPIRLPLTTPAT